MTLSEPRGSTSFRMVIRTGINPGTGIYLFGKSNSGSRNSKSMENCDCSMCKFTHATIQRCQKCCTGDRKLSMRLENLE